MNLKRLEEILTTIAILLFFGGSVTCVLWMSRLSDFPVTVKLDDIAMAFSTVCVASCCLFLTARLVRSLRALRAGIKNRNKPT